MRVLLVDCDPQCNSTQLVLGQSVCERLYYKATDDVNRDTILKMLKPILDGDSSIDRSVTVFSGKENRFGVDLIAGHPQLSVLEDMLSDAWGKLTAGHIEGFRRNHWSGSLVSEMEQRGYDLVLFDVGPSLGSLNRSVLIGSECFVTPMGCDIFSIVGIRNIASWLTSWLANYKTGWDLCESKRSGTLASYSIGRSLSIEQGFVGYTVQQYITKARGGVRRPTLAYESIMQDIPGEVAKNLGAFSRGVLSDRLKLGDVPHLYSLVPLAQLANAPIMGLGSGDDLVGSQYSQARKFGDIIEGVASKLGANLGIEVAE